MNKKQYMTVKEVSRYLSLPLSTIYDLIREKKIKSTKIGGRIRCLAKDIENYDNFGTDSASNQTRTKNYQNNRRKFPRINSDFDCNYSIDLQRFKDTIVKGIILNLSPEGVFVQRGDCEASGINVDDPIVLRFSLNHKYETCREINVNGRVLRKHANGFAVKFRQIDKKLKDTIKEYIG